MTFALKNLLADRQRSHSHSSHKTRKLTPHTRIDTMPPAASDTLACSEHSSQYDPKEMKELMDKWNGEFAQNEDLSVSESSDVVLDYDDALEKYRRSVSPGSNEVDHILLGTSDFDKAMEVFKVMTGEEPVMVVSLNGLGTKSARLAFESCAYLEIVGPDPKQGSTPMGDKLKSLPSDGSLVPLHYAVRHDEATTTIKKTTLPDLNYTADQVTMIAKDKGMPWKWDMIILENHSDGGIPPMFVNWGEATHGAAKLPIVGALEDVLVQAPVDNKVHDLVRTVDGVTVRSGDTKLEFTFSSKMGKHTFTSDSPLGISFPAAGGLNPKATKAC